MGNYDPNILPFESLPYRTSWNSGFTSPAWGQHYKRYREEALKRYHSFKPNISDTLAYAIAAGNPAWGQHYKRYREEALKRYHSFKPDISDTLAYAVAAGDTVTAELIKNNIDKFYYPIDYSYYAILLSSFVANKEDGKYPVMRLNINVAALSSIISSEFEELISKINLDDINKSYDGTHISVYNYSTYTDTINTAFYEVLKFFLERSEFIPTERPDDDILYAFIYGRRSDTCSLKWKDIKALKEFTETNYSDHQYSRILSKLVDSAEAMQYKPADNVYYFCMFSRNTSDHYLKRDLDKSPKTQKKPASN